MIRCYVEKHSYFRFKLVSSIQLKTAYLKYIPVMQAFSYLSCHTESYVSRQRDAEACVLHQMICKQGRRSFSICSCNCNDLTVSIARSKLDLVNDCYPRRVYFFYDLSFIWNSGTLDHQLCVENQVFGMDTFLENNIFFGELNTVLLSDLGLFRDKNIIAFDLGQERCSRSTFTCT